VAKFPEETSYKRTHEWDKFMLRWFIAGITLEASRNSFGVTRWAHKKAPEHDSQGLNKSGAGEMNRTPDLLITNELLYRLSYTG
jgi:hypothetical protein